MQRASRDLPDPGAPIISRWCRPAAAISSARRARSCPLTEARSTETAGRSITSPALGGRDRRLSGEMAHHLVERGGCEDLRGPDPGRFGPRAAGAEERAILFGGRDRGRQGACHRHEAPVERQFSDGEDPLDLFGGHDLERGQKCQRDGEIEVRAFLGQIGRREVHRDPARGQGDGHGGERRPHRSRASETALSGRPTMAKAGSPGETAHCTSTLRGSMPSKATVKARAIMGVPFRPSLSPNWFHER